MKSRTWLRRRKRKYLPLRCASAIEVVVTVNFPLPSRLSQGLTNRAQNSTRNEITLCPNRMCVISDHSSIKRAAGLDAERLDYQSSHRSPRKLLLASDEIPVTNCMRFEPAGLVGEKSRLHSLSAFCLVDGRPTGSNAANRVCWDYFQLAGQNEAADEDTSTRKATIWQVREISSGHSGQSSIAWDSSLDHSSLAYSALASFKIGTSASASFQSVKKS
jgi:hypothetical protein